LSVPPSEYCREIETYLCRKNDGHLIRVVGPSFDLVSRWANDGVPLKVAFRGIDRYFERYYRNGPRRRPVRIDFCEADVLDVFDEWRRAVGPVVGAAGDGDADRATKDKKASLPAHLERVLLRLTNARAKGDLGAEADTLIDRLSLELDRARAQSGGVRGEARRALVDRLAALDRELVAIGAATRAIDRAALEREADEELADFKARLTAENYTRAREAIVERLTRERLGLPIISY
jgi:hypothetical protein